MTTAFETKSTIRTLGELILGVLLLTVPWILMVLVWSRRR